jgi:hypothetical protein
MFDSKIPSTVTVPMALLTCEYLKPNDKLVYIALLFHAGKKLACMPSLRRIKKLSGISSMDTVSKCIKSLEEHNMIRVFHPGKKSRYQSNYYLLARIEGVLRIPPRDAQGQETSQLKLVMASLSIAFLYTNGFEKEEILNQLTEQDEFRKIVFDKTDTRFSHLFKALGYNSKIA